LSSSINESNKENIPKIIESNFERIKNWLEEDKIAYKELSDETTYFTLKVTISNIHLAIFQPKTFVDHFFITTNINISQDHLKALQEQDQDKKLDFFRKIRHQLTNDSNVLEFEILPKPPELISTINIASYWLYYDGLTKEKLIYTLYGARKNLFKIICIIEDHTGMTVQNTRQLRYSPYG
jgi:hypothetical protein